MGKGAPSQPPPIPPGDTAKAQYGSNVASAGFGVEHMLPQLRSPYANVDVDKYGLPDVNLGNGQTAPGGQGASQSTTSLAPPLDATFNSMPNSLQDYAGFMPSGPFNPDLDTDRLESAYRNNFLRQAQPEWDRQDQAFNVTMAERGLPIGSEIFNNERNRMESGRNTALADANDRAVQAGANEESRQYAQQQNQYLSGIDTFSRALNPILASIGLMEGATPSLVPVGGLPGTDRGAIDANYNRQIGQNSAMQAAGQGSMYGLLGSGIGAGMGLLQSDKDVKHDIKQVGETYDGQNIYSFKYDADPSETTHVGLMAQEVEERNPDAVVEIGGIKHVHYGRATSLASMLRGA